MNSASNASGTTHTTMTLLDNMGSMSTLSNGCVGDRDYGCSTATPSVSSTASASSSNNRIPIDSAGAINGGGDIDMHQIFNYKEQRFVNYPHMNTVTSEEICIDLCRSLNILPTTRLLFGLRVYDDEKEWAVPGEPLRRGVRYCFRMRFKVPAQDTQLQPLDPHAYEYLYRQMRYDMVHECIPEIRYPAERNNVMGLGMLDMYIDLLERRDTIRGIEDNFKHYLPKKLVRAHKMFVKPKLCDRFKKFRKENVDLARVKWYYVHEIHTLAPNYLLETYTTTVDFIPDDETAAANTAISSKARVYVKLDMYDAPEPGLKISRITSEDKLKWILVTKLENIYALYTESKQIVRLEITGFPNGYGMHFDKKTHVESFITYLSGYIRLTSKWMLDLCVQYLTPSLQELKKSRCHGPIGGGFSFAKIREKRDEVGTYIIRECEKEYNTYYIDINTKSYASLRDKCKTETYKVKKDGNRYIVHTGNGLSECNDLGEAARHVVTDEHIPLFRLPPSEYDKPPLLLICLPKKLQSKKTETELSDAELQRKRVQIFDRKIDLQWYKNSERECDNGKMVRLRADWIQQGSGVKDVSVTLKVLKNDGDFAEFMKLTDLWSKVYSPHFIKLYGLTLSTPYTMVMEYAKYGPLNEFLMRHKEKVSVRSLLDVVHGLVRGIVYLHEYNIKHGYIRCSNLYVTKFDPKSNLLEAKIGDPGFPRSYTKEELAWIPFEYQNDFNAAKDDPNAEFWAFGTTVWEIFARGKPITNLTPELLRLNYNRYGGILPPPSDDCPEDMYKTMMDGWSQDPDSRFNHQEIFSRLIFAKEGLSSNYTTVDGPNEALFDSTSLTSEYSDMTRGTLHDCQSTSDVQSSSYSNNSTSCDRAPLIRSHKQTNGHGRQNNGYPLCGSKANYHNYFDETQSVLQLPNGKVIYKKKIGEGHYGTVYLGEIRYNTPGKEREMVAIKTLKSLRPSQLNKDFMREINIMKSLDHPNIVKIKQWVEDPISIIMEYVECGSFIVYLTSRKPNLTNDKLLRFALDIAKGMEYLRSQKVIHRDLAARNILVDRDSVKISDFGLAQIANSDGYYFGHSVREIPIKWYSPESIKTAKFSFQSDVWSYGVTLFEMFSRGETPNLESEKELTQEDFLNRLEKGDRLHKPDMCPSIVYEKLMLPCWHAQPKERPTFKDLLDVIQSIKNESGENV